MKEKVTLYQFFILMTLLPYGSAILFFLVPDTKQNVWIAMLIYCIGGIILQLIYTTIYYKYPEDTLVTYLPKIYGNILGRAISIIYISYFTYIGARVLRDYTELIRILGLVNTPMIITGIIFILIVIYIVDNGIETIASTSQVLFIGIISTPFIVWILVIFTKGILKFDNLKPILQDGIFDVIKKGWPLITFPYGETILFTMIYPMVAKREKIRKFAVSSIIFEGIILSISSMLFVVTLGVYRASSSVCPLFNTVRIINLGNLMTRLDALFIVVLIVGGFIKITLFMYVAVLGTSQIIKSKNRKFLSYTFGIIILFLSNVMAKDYLEHLEIGLDFVVKYIHVPLQIIVPILTLVVYYTKNMIKQNNVR